MVIDYEKVADLAAIAMTHQEIANRLGVSLSRLEHDPEFVQAYKRGFTQAIEGVRRAQYNSAIQGNVTAQIWFGKNNMGQSDRPLPEEDEAPALDEVMRMFMADCEAHGV